METKREIIMRQIGAKIAYQRKIHGYSQEQLSQKLHLGKTVLSRVQPEHLPQYAAGYCRGPGRAGVGVRILHAGGAGPLERLRPPGYGGDGGRRDEIRPPPARKESELSPLS